MRRTFRSLLMGFVCCQTIEVLRTVVALRLIYRRSNASERTVRFLAHASVHPHDHAAAGGAKSLVADDKEVLARLVGTSDHRGIQYWRGFVYQASAITVRSGRPSGGNHVSGSCKTVPALVKRERRG